MRTVVVGCGNHGGETLLPAACSAGISIAALVDQNLDRARQLAELWMIPQVYGSVENLDPRTFDAAILALPVTEQAAHTSWALSHHLHTFVEKPPAPHPARLHELVEQSRAASVVCCVGMNYRWAEGVLRLLAALECGHYGTVSYARVEHIARKPIEPFGSDLSLEASLFAAQGIHAIDLGQLLLPDKATVSGQMVEVRRGRLCAMVAEGQDSPTRLEVQFGSCAAAFSHHVEVITSHGDILQLRNLAELVHLPNGADPHVSEYPGARVLWRSSPTTVGYASAGYGPELDAFRSTVGGGQAPRLATLEDLLPVYDAFGALLDAEGLPWTA
ncbi:Gfo/Idh/MocA family protein [Cryptosporangium sp. NPDC048952]|uniref:Gfo/Idh/MocA family protein n=1 Tax=Cryptosporangium sp. NPDC048952 TaxID=3363961 RepID=UPI0037116C0B